MVVNGQKKTTMSIKRIRQGCIINKQEVLTWFCKTERKRADWWTNIGVNTLETTKADLPILIY